MELVALEHLKKSMSPLSSVAFVPILFKDGGNMDMHILNEFEFLPDGTTDYGVSCP